ncbi:hypothetical protein IIB34_08820, partial [PVC group bacterium]|nr:hypothetical protein [PVC group bacterium]
MQRWIYKIIYMVFLSLGGTAEALLVFAFMREASWMILLGLHTLACVLITFGVVWGIRQDLMKANNRSLAYFSVIITFFFPVANLLVLPAFLWMVIGLRANLKTNVLDSFEEEMELASSENKNLMSLKGDLSLSRHEIGFEPFVDIIRGNEVKLKSRVIDKLSRTQTKESIMLLKEAVR